ncbi:MAG: methyltransferase, partial [Lentisphaeria bacterium]|nr:methyltransferase [Lentisphaeria bacterium]
IVCYYTMQFIKPNVRQDIFNKLYEALNWGGALVLFEKVRANDARFQDICVSLYDDFKLDNGFTPAEIMAKRQSLKGVLEPFSSQGNRDLLTRAGFEDILTIMKYVSFEGFLAIK